MWTRMAAATATLTATVAGFVVCSAASPPARTQTPQAPETRASTPRSAIPAVPAGRDHYVSPAGASNGDGSAERPWDLQTALSQPGRVSAGDTLWLRGGTYTGTFTSSLRGDAARPIVVRQYPGERATIDGAGSNGAAILTVKGAYTWYWGFEVLSSNEVRSTSDTGSWPPGSALPRGEAILVAQTSETGAGLRFINMVIHDARQGISFWKEAVDGEISGCLIYYNGWEAPDRGHGHAIYAQNQTGTKTIADNIIFSGFSHGIHIYGSDSAYLNNFVIEGNTISNAGDLSASGGRNILLGGGRVAENPVVAENLIYRPPPGQTSEVDLGYAAGCANATIRDNYVSANTLFVNCPPVVMTGNSFLGTVGGIDSQQYPHNVFQGGATTLPRVFVRVNRYEAGRGHVTVFNPGKAESAAVDLSGVLESGSSYEIRNAANFYGAPVASGRFDGAPVVVNLTGLLPVAPVGWASPAATGPLFNAFVVTTTGVARAGPLPPGGRREPKPVERTPGR